MTTSTFMTGPVQASQNRKAVTAISTAGTSAFTTDWQMFIDTNIVVALTGTATSVTATVERSAVDPGLLVNGTAQGAKSTIADSTGFSGNLATGVPPNIYTESGVGWWRVNVSAVSGGNCVASLSGKA